MTFPTINTEATWPENVWWDSEGAYLKGEPIQLAWPHSGWRLDWTPEGAGAVPDRWTPMVGYSEDALETEGRKA